MKTNLISITITACLALFALPACESKEQNSNDAFDRFKEEKMMAKDCVLISNDTLHAVKKVESPKTNESLDEWMIFKNEIEKKISMNSNRIKKIKQTPEANIKLFKKIVHLEKDNSDLKVQLKEYENEVNLNLKKFKERVNLQVKDMDIKIKDMSIQEKKS